MVKWSSFLEHHKTFVLNWIVAAARRSQITVLPHHLLRLQGVGQAQSGLDFNATTLHYDNSRC